MDEVEVGLEEMVYMEEAIRKADEERDQAIREKEKAIAAKDFAHKQAADLTRHLKTQKKSFAKELNKANNRYVKSLAKPTTWLIAVGTFSWVVHFLVKHELVSPLLGNPVISVCICICSVFIGIIMERIEIKRKAQYHIRKDEQTWQ